MARLRRPITITIAIPSMPIAIMTSRSVKPLALLSLFNIMVIDFDRPGQRIDDQGQDLVSIKRKMDQRLLHPADRIKLCEGLSSRHLSLMQRDDILKPNPARKRDAFNRRTRLFRRFRFAHGAGPVLSCIQVIVEPVNLFRDFGLIAEVTDRGDQVPGRTGEIRTEKALEL